LDNIALVTDPTNDQEDAPALQAQIDALTRRVESLSKQSAEKEPASLARQRPVQAVVGGVAVAIAVLFYLVLANADDARRDVDFARSETNVVRQVSARAQNGVSRLESRVTVLEARPVPRPAAATAKHVPRFSTVVRPGTVRSVTGDAPVSKGDECTLSVKSADGGSGLNCRIHLRCGGKALYGKALGGFLICNIDDGKPTFGRDEDPSSSHRKGELGDPRFELDLTKNRVVVSDGPTPEFSVEVALEVR